MKDNSRNRSVGICKNVTSVIPNSIFVSKQNKIQKIIEGSGLHGLNKVNNLYSLNRNRNQDGSLNNKLYSLKMNILVPGSNGSNSNNAKQSTTRQTSNLSNDFSKFFQSPHISDSLRNKFSQVYSQALDNKLIGKVNVNNHHSNNNQSKNDNYISPSGCSNNFNNFNSKKQEILKILNSAGTERKPARQVNINTNFNTNMKSKNVDNNLNNLSNIFLLSPIRCEGEKQYRSGSADFVPEKNTERILKMKNKFKKLLEDDFMITPLIEEGDSFNFPLTKEKETIRGDKDSLFESSRGGASTKRIKRTTSLSSIKDQDKDNNFNLNLNFNDTSREKINLNLSHKRTRSAYAESLPFKKEILELGDI